MPEQRFILTYNGSSETLTVNPDGWSRNGRLWKRHRVYHGVFQSYTVDSYRFARGEGGGGEFIISAYDAEDIKAEVLVSVYNRNPQTDDFDLTYTGKLYFDPDKFKVERDFVEIGFVQTGLIQDFINRDELDVDITTTTSIDGDTVTAATVTNITFPGVDIFRIAQTSGNFNYNFYFSLQNLCGTSFERQGICDSEWVQAGNEVQMKYYANTITINELGDSFQATTGPANAIRSLYLYENPTTEAVVITFDLVDVTSNSLTVTYYSGGGLHQMFVNFFAIVYDSDNNVISTNQIDTKTFTNASGVGDPYSIPLGINPELLNGLVFSVPSEGKLAVYMQFTSTPYSIPEWQIPGFVMVRGTCSLKIDITEKSFGSASKALPCYRFKEAMKQILKLISGENDPITSSYFDFYTNDIVISGWNLREFPNKPFTVNFRALYDTIFSLRNLGVGYDRENNKITVESLSHYYDTSFYIADLGEVANLVITPYKPAYYNSIKAGSENEGNYEELNGANEFNVVSDWVTDQPVSEIANLRAKYNTDTVGIELARRKTYTTYASEDTDQDDLIFVAYEQMGSVYQGGTNLSGFKGIEQYYNLKYTPRECLIRHGNLIKSMYWRETDFKIRFSKSKKAVNIKYTNQNGDLVNEFDPINASELTDDKLIIPKYYEFDGIFNEEIADNLELNPHGLIIFTFDGLDYAGFVDEVQTQDYDRQAKYKLIAYEATSGELMQFEDGTQATFEDGENIEFD